MMAPRKKSALKMSAAQQRLRRRVAAKWKADLDRAHSVVDGIHDALRVRRRAGDLAKRELDLRIGDLENLKEKIKKLKFRCFNA
jgi:hypothetical protein